MCLKMPLLVAAGCLFLWTAAGNAHENARRGDSLKETGTVAFRPVGDETKIPARYRLKAHTFPYKLTYKQRFASCGVDVFRLQYPSPVTSPCPENNTVYAEYYRPEGPGKFPGVIVLDITGGDQNLSRAICTFLAENKIAGLFVQMAYYGPRRPPGSSLRL